MDQHNEGENEAVGTLRRTKRFVLTPVAPRSAGLLPLLILSSMSSSRSGTPLSVASSTLSVKQEKACDGCYKARKKCDFMDPCSRCQDKQFLCQYSLNRSRDSTPRSRPLVQTMTARREHFVQAVSQRIQLYMMQRELNRSTDEDDGETLFHPDSYLHAVTSGAKDRLPLAVYQVLCKLKPFTLTTVGFTRGNLPGCLVP